MQQLIRKVEAHDGGTEAEKIFRRAGEERANVSGTLETSSSFHLPVVILQLDRTSLLYCQGITTALQEFGGVKGLSYSLKTNLEKGIKGDDDDLLKRKYEFGSNTYPWEKGSFWMFLWEAWQNPTLIILIVAAVTSLALESSGPWRNWEAEKWHRNLFHIPGGVLLVKRLGFANAGAGIPASDLSFHSGY